MCGIVGLFTNSESGLWHADGKAIRDLITANSVRGYDGTGLFFRQRNRKTNEHTLFYHKKAVVGPSLLEKNAWGSFLEDSRFVVGHNRAATIGEINEDNTHPFIYGDVTGVHNGTISSWKSTLYDYIDKAQMDSQAVFEALSKVDPDPESVGKLLSKLEVGAYALVWWDERVKKLRFARNDDRPLHFVRTRRGFAFGSELRMLEWVLDRHSLAMEKAVSLSPHRLLDVSVDGEKAESHDYSTEAKAFYRSRSRTYNNWPDPNNDYWDDDYDSVPWRGYGGYGNYRGYHDGYVPANGRAGSTVPKKVLVTNNSDLDGLVLDAWTKSKVRNAVHFLAGCKQATATLSVADGLKNLFLKDRPDVPDFPSLAMPTADFHVIDLDGTTPIGYLQISEGDIEPATLISRLSEEQLEILKDTIDRGNEAVIPECPVIGVYAYAHGDVAYALGSSKQEVKDIRENVIDSSMAEWWTGIATRINHMHPEVLRATNKSGWYEGWLNQ